jgi:ribosomal protein S18 acetylase RimI-like enzyme
MGQENNEQPGVPSAIVRRMIDVRAATAADAEELVRLRAVLFGEATPGAWRAQALVDFQRKLVDGSLVAFVVEAGQPGRLAASAVGVVEERIAGPSNPSGLLGYVFNVATDPSYRRRGYSRACMQRLLAWYQRKNITRVDLMASPEGEPLYASLGFVRRTDPAMRLTW